MKKTEKRLTYCLEENWRAGKIHNLVIHDNRLILPVNEHIFGIILLPPADSRSNGFQWDRVMIDAAIPKESSMEIFAYASDNREAPVIQHISEEIEAKHIRYIGFTDKIEKYMGQLKGHGADFLADLKGRYLWILILLLSGGKKNPEIRKVTFRMEGDHMVDYLPAIYGGSSVTKRFLSVFNSIYTDMDRQIDSIPSMLDYEKNSESMLRFLAGWMGIEDGYMSADNLRTYMTTVLEEYENMYTVEGIRRSIIRLTGKNPIILEPADVDPNAENCPDPELYRKIYKDDPYRFYVLFEEGSFETRESMERFQEQMEQLIPAGTSMEIVMLQKNIRLGRHSYLGVNAGIGDYKNIAINKNTVINYETVIGGQSDE